MIEKLLLCASLILILCTSYTLIWLIHDLTVNEVIFDGKRMEGGTLIEEIKQWKNISSKAFLFSIFLVPFFILDVTFLSIKHLLKLPVVINNKLKTKIVGRNKNENSHEADTTFEPCYSINFSYTIYKLNDKCDEFKIYSFDKSYDSYKEFWKVIKEIYKRPSLYKSSYYTIETLYNSLTYIYKYRYQEFEKECNRATKILKSILAPIIKAEQEQKEEEKRLREKRVDDFMEEYHKQLEFLESLWKDGNNF